MENVYRFTNRINEIRSGKVSFGTWAQIGHPSSVEVLASAGFDWIAVDCEHTDIAINELTNMFRGLSAYDIVPMVRVKNNDEMAIRRPLDNGAVGVIVPLVNSAKEAMMAVSAAKYPPLGKRGYAFCRANEYGKEFDSYVDNINTQSLLFVMIETKEAVDAIDEILDVEGVDGVFVGTYDLSGSLSVIGKTDHPKVIQALAKVVESAKKHAKTAGIHMVMVTEETLKKNLDDGFTFIALGMDNVFMFKAASSTLLTAKNMIRD